MNREWITAVRDKVRDKPRLTPVFQTTLNIPERLHETNPRLFIVYNNISNRFELHSLDQDVSFCADLPYRALDSRTLRWIWQNDIRVHGKELMRRFDEQEAKKEQSEKREFSNWVESVGKETRSLFAKDAWVAT